MGVSLLLVPIIIAAADAMPRLFAGSDESEGRVLRLPTRIKDAELLRAALHDYGCASVEEAGSVHSLLDTAQIVFQPGAEGRHDAVFVGTVTDERARAFVDAVEHEYARLVQARVYERLKQKAAQRGMKLEREKVDADGSVVLRYAMPVRAGR
ncbi:hypothetical protein [Longimicrobium sp.]|jgi:hypothetical protein|uniref:hypothetical protein n=1 Tax=Longimicrobium sp. TaxID=2029185 RepID=UPI002ED7C203